MKHPGQEVFCLLGELVYSVVLDADGLEGEGFV